MKCKKIQELILTDYLDDQMSKAVRGEIENHLKMCPTCRQFEYTLLKAVISPIRKAERIKPPASVWNNISQVIIGEKKRKSEGFFLRFQNLFEHTLLRPKVALTLGLMGAVLFILLAVRGFQVNNQRVAKIWPESQSEYLSDLYRETDYFSIEENEGYGTAIEEYFL